MRALNFGFVLQITYNLPRRFTIWQSAWRFFADFSDDNIFMAVIQFQVKSNLASQIRAYPVSSAR